MTASLLPLKILLKYRAFEHVVVLTDPTIRDVDYLTNLITATIERCGSLNKLSEVVVESFVALCAMPADVLDHYLEELKITSVYSLAMAVVVSDMQVDLSSNCVELDLEVVLSSLLVAV